MLTIRPYYKRPSLRGYLWAICLEGVPVSLHIKYPGEIFMNNLSIGLHLDEECLIEYNDDFECMTRYEFTRKPNDQDGNAVVLLDAVVFYSAEKQASARIPEWILGVKFISAKEEEIESMIMEAEAPSFKFSDVDEQTGIRRQGEL